MNAQGQQRWNHQPGLLNAADVGRNWQGCLLRAARDGLLAYPNRRGEQFGSAYCKTGMFCGRADESRISTMIVQRQQRRNHPPGLLNAEDVGRNGQGCLLRAARDGLQGLPIR
jgi:hypothetical protein